MRKLLFIFFSSILFSQNISEEIINKQINRRNSPDALFKVSDIPVSLNNGMTSIPINIASLNFKDILIPLNLNYYSRGFKVDEVASETGLGWNTNFPFKISRSITNYEDESQNGFINNNVYTRDIYTNKDKMRSIVGDMNTGSLNIDLEPDKFYLNLPNYSGKFIFDNFSNKFVLQDHSEYKIEYNLSSKKFTVVDNKGYTYYFGGDYLKYDQSESYIYDNIQNNYISNNNSSDYPSSWYLYKITDKNNDSISFKYINNNLQYFNRGYDETKMSIQDGGLGGSEGSFNSYFSKIVSNELLLQEIILNKQKIKLNYSERNDVISGLKLDNVNVLYNDKLIEKTVLEYEDVLATINNNNNIPFLVNMDSRSNTRMFLKKIIKNNNEITLFKYKNIEKLPNRFSNSRDIWGYFNDSNQNIKFNDISGLYNQPANLKVNPLVSSNGIIEEIIYPTGGKTKFTFENNRGNSQLLNNSKLQLYHIPYIDYNDGIVSYDLTFRNYTTFNNNTFTLDFITPNFFNKNNVIINFRNNTFQHESGASSLCENVMGEIVDENNNVVPIFSQYGHNWFIPSNNEIKVLNFGALQNATKYKLRVTFFNCSDIYMPSDFKNFYLNIKFEDKYPDNLIYGDGHRIKSIINYDENDKKTNIRNFEYLTNQGKESGIIFGYPFYYTKLGTMPHNNNIAVLDKFGVKPGSAMSSYNINSIIYPYVTEYIVDSKNENLNHKIEYTFSEDREGGEYYLWPYFSSIDNEYLRGRLLSKKEYSSKNNNYKLLKESIYIYKFKNILFKSYINLSNGLIFLDDYERGYVNYLKDNHGFLYPLVRFYYNIEGLFSNYEPDDKYLLSYQKSSIPSDNLYFKPFYYVSANKYLSKTIINEYFDNNTELTTEINYNYDSPNHLQVTKQTTTNSKGDIINTEYQYPPDLVGQRPFADILTTQNRIAEPMITTTRNGEQVISSVYTEYNDFNGIIQKSRVFQKKGSSSIVEGDDVIAFNSYDSFGNITQYTPKNGSSVSIIWGYNGQYPVAKIEGDTYANSITKIGSLLTKLQNGTLTPIEENSIRGLFPDAMITTYKYKPLIGVTSITGPNGLTEIYEYDSAGRLEVIRNHKNEILKTFKYNYKN